MDKNYFSDITELFIKAKKAENIEVNPHSKAAIREMLAYKVDQLKTSKPAETGFFAKWKYQLVGVPASIFAVVMVAYAFQNLQISMPKEDFAPTESNESLTSESIFGESEIQVETAMTESDTPVIKDIEKPKPELMVIDYGESAPKPQPTYVSKPAPVVQPVTETALVKTAEPQVTETAKVVDAAPAVVKKTPTYIEPQPTTTKPGISTGGAFSVYTPPSTTDNSGYTMISNDLDKEIEATSIVPLPEIDIPQNKIEPMEVQNMMEGSIQLTPLDSTSETGTINEYRQPFIPQASDFNTDALNAIEKPDSLSNVNVHYLNKSQAAVEVIENDTTRWYMFENIEGTWKITQKFD